MVHDIEQVHRALQPIGVSLEADGYELVLDAAEGGLMVQVRAGEQACADCLVPKEVMESMIRDELARAGFEFEALEVRYPEP